MAGLHVVAHARIHPGKLEEFRQAANRAMTIVREKDLGTLRYDWFMSADGTECIVLEHYADSAALLAHIANLGPGLGLLFSLADIEIEVMGDISPEHKAAVAGIPHKAYSPMQALNIAPA